MVKYYKISNSVIYCHPTKMASRNLLMLGHSPKCIHIITYAWFPNVVSHELISRKILIWGLKVLSLYHLVKGPNMAILK
jgi:hypothetical protein